MGSSLHASPDRARLRTLVRQAPDHYEILDGRLIRRLAGVLFCTGGALAGALLPFDQPTAAFGALGWVPAGAIVGVALVVGVALILSTRTLGTGPLMAIAISGPVMYGTLQWLAGAESSYVHLLILSVVWCGVVLPARRLLIILLADAVVLFLPATYGDLSVQLLPGRITTLGIAWTLSVLCLAWSFRLRGMRRTLEAQRAAADELARVDVLTGLDNRRALEEALVCQSALARRSGRSMAVLVGDLDRFKAINDLHGHHTGDRVLRDVARVLRDVVRTPDQCFRWGGDEFVVLLGEADEAQAHDIADRVAAAIRERCATPDGAPVTMTFGAAARSADAIGTELLATADAALLAAKSAVRAA